MAALALSLVERDETPALFVRLFRRPRGHPALSSGAQIDETRPSIESYRRRDEIDLLLPVADEAPGPACDSRTG